MKITNFSTDLNSQKQIREQGFGVTGNVAQKVDADETVNTEIQEEVQEKVQKSRKTKRVSTEKV